MKCELNVDEGYQNKYTAMEQEDKTVLLKTLDPPPTVAKVHVKQQTVQDGRNLYSWSLVYSKFCKSGWT